MNKICRYYGKFAKQWRNKKGHLHSYYKTCGSAICLAQSHRQQKRAITSYREKEIIATCPKCSNQFLKDAPSRLHCKRCVPNNHAARRLRIYGLSEPEYLILIQQNGGLCKLCLKRPATDIDHDHITGRVRGFICTTCNAHLVSVEAPGWLARVKEYLENSNALCF